jgi:hypothetical protein
MTTSHTPYEGNPQQLSLSDLSQQCYLQLHTLMNGGTPDGRYPVELFRRAIIQQDPHAWAILYQQFSPFILVFLTRLHAAEMPGCKSTTGLVEKTMMAVAHNLTAEKLTRLGTLVALLSYCKVCLFSVITEAQRSQVLLERAGTMTSAEADAHPPVPPDYRQAVTSSSAGEALWQLLEQELPSQDEQQLCSLLFVQGLSAQEICDLDRERFPDVETVYQREAAIIASLSSSQRLQALLLDLEQ